MGGVLTFRKSVVGFLWRNGSDSSDDSASQPTTECVKLFVASLVEGGVHGAVEPDTPDVNAFQGGRERERPPWQAESSTKIRRGQGPG